jgi:fatty-acyl-CoA synthase
LGHFFARRDAAGLFLAPRHFNLTMAGGYTVPRAYFVGVLPPPRGGADAVVVRRPDPRWGEVPVAVIARNDERLTAGELYAKCREQLAGYKQPKDIRFVAFADLPRSTTGKIQRHEVEAWLRREDAEVR